MAGVFGRSPDEAEDWIRSWTASVSERAAAAQELSERVAVLRVAATGVGGAVRVEVAGSGVVTDLRLEPAALERPAGELAAEILRVMRRAQAGLAGEVADAARATVGLESDTGKAVVGGFRARFPAESDDPDEPWGGARGRVGRL